jgi:uncharacterized damage-inducible protein DinB
MVCFPGMTPSLQLDELLAYCEAESHKWRRWLQANPETLAIPLNGIALANSVMELVVHIIAVDLRYSERLLNQAITTYEQMQREVTWLFATHDRAFANLRQFLANAKEEDWKQVIEFPTRSMGTLNASRRKIFVHTLLHSVRHWAQLATALRQAGHKQDWQHDFLFADVMD